MARSTLIFLPAVALVSCGALLLGGLQSAGAVDTNAPVAGQTPAPADSKAAAFNGAQTQVTALKQEQTQLRRMGEAIKRLRRAGMDIIGECTQPLEMMGEIDIIGQDVIPIMPATAEGFEKEYIPPRPKYIKLHMDQLSSLLPILQDDIDQLVIPDSEKSFADQPMQDLNGYMGDLKLHYKKLKSLTRSGDYDQVGLTNEARGIDSACKAMEGARKKLLHEDEKLEKQEEKVEHTLEKK